VEKQVKKSRSSGGLLVLLVIVLVAAAGYYAYTGYYSKEGMIAKTAAKAYELYSSADKQKDIRLFLGDPDKDGFKQYKAKIFDTKAVLNQVKQAVLLLLQAPPAGYVSFMPQGTALRDVYLDPNNICYVDLSGELSKNSNGGSTGEYMTAYSIVDSICTNFQEIKGVKILIDGKEADSIAGHFRIKDVLKPTE